MLEIDLSFILHKRKANGYSLQDVSDNTGINVMRLSRIEKENDIRLSELIKLALFFGVDEKELYEFKITK